MNITILNDDRVKYLKYQDATKSFATTIANSHPSLGFNLQSDARTINCTFSWLSQTCSAFSWFRLYQDHSLV